MNNYKTILAIESSCDETACAVVVGDGVGQVKILSNIIASQIKIHEQYGGVFPDLAAQEHVKKIIPTIEVALKEAGIWQKNVKQSLESVDAIAVTVGPGLIGSLLVGVNSASTLALLAGKPLIQVNHWAGHIYSIFIENAEKSKVKKQKAKNLPEFPLLVLTVSGGHSSLILMKNHFDFEIIGETVDDAAGEVFDKIARMLNLGFPGGPAISRSAEQVRLANSRLAVKFPRPKINDNDFNFSFSGLKTAVLYAIQKKEIILPQDANIAAREAEDAIVEVLVKKTIKAVKQFKPKSLALVGGVSANKFLRNELSKAVGDLNPKPQFFMSDLAYSTDNASMIGAVATFQLALGKNVLVDPTEAKAIAGLRIL